MINIEMPSPNVVVVKQEILGDIKKPPLSSLYGFTDYEKIPRNIPGVYMFYNDQEELLYCGKTDRGLRNRIKDHFYDDSSPIKNHRDEVNRIAVCFVEDAFEREIYETFMIHHGKAKYNKDKVFFK